MFLVQSHIDQEDVQTKMVDVGSMSTAEASTIEFPTPPVEAE